MISLERCDIYPPQNLRRHIDPKNSQVLVETHFSTPKLMAVPMLIGRQGTRDEE